VYKYLIVVFFNMVMYADTDIQRGIYDAADEMIRFDEKMNRAIAEHNHIDINENQNGSTIEDFEEIEGGYILTQQIQNRDNVTIDVKVENGMLSIITTTSSNEDSEYLSGIIADSNISGFENTISSASTSISIPNDADETKMEKSYKNGLLKIKFPKKKIYLK